MKVIRTSIDEVLVLEPVLHRDDRGFMFESYSERREAAVLGPGVRFVQENHSRSTRGVLRGLHFQREPYAQGKLVRVAHGAVFDVAVDIRKGSPTFGRWVGAELSSENHLQMWIPAGFAHGFLALTDTADVLYKATRYYAPQAEGAIRWDDPDLAIEWPDLGTAPRVSPKDASAPLLSRARLDSEPSPETLS